MMMNDSSTRRTSFVARLGDVDMLHTDSDVHSAEEEGPISLAEQAALQDVFIDDDDDDSAITTYKKHSSSTCSSSNLVKAMVGILILVIVLAIVLGGRDDPITSTEAPITTFPRNSTEINDIRQTLLNQLGHDYIVHNDVLHHPMRILTLDWLLYEDPLHLSASDDHLLQRFVLALLYFSTSRSSSSSSSWQQCNPPTSTGPTTESELCFNPTGGYFGDDPGMTGIWGHKWLTNVHECLWAGVYCDSLTHTVVTIGLFFNELSGPIPWEIAALTNLVDLSLNNNRLTGTIPTELGGLKALNHIALGGNRLTGTIPTELFRRGPGDAPLMLLSLRNNFLQGTIPTQVGLMNGTYLDLAQNDLNGTLPMELFQETNLIQVFLDNNTKILGSLPTEIGLWSNNIHYLDFSQTGLTGTIPSEIGLLSSIVQLTLSKTNLTGTLPEEAYRGWKRLSYLDLAECQFIGTISPLLGRLQDLSWFHINDNHFSGTLPTEIGQLTNLGSVTLQGNPNLNGTIPTELCSLSKLAEGDHWLGEFELVADCMPDELTGIADLVCPEQCCTTCCRSQTGACVVN